MPRILRPSETANLNGFIDAPVVEVRPLRVKHDFLGLFEKEGAPAGHVRVLGVLAQLGNVVAGIRPAWCNVQGRRHQMTGLG